MTMIIMEGAVRGTRAGMRRRGRMRKRRMLAGMMRRAMRRRRMRIRMERIRGITIRIRRFRSGITVGITGDGVVVGDGGGS